MLSNYYYKPFYKLNIPLELVIYIINCAIENKCNCFKYDIIIAMKNVSRRWKKKILLIQEKYSVTNEHLDKYLKINKTPHMNCNFNYSSNSCDCKHFTNKYIKCKSNDLASNINIGDTKCHLCLKLVSLDHIIFNCKYPPHKCKQTTCHNHISVNKPFKFDYCNRHILLQQFQTIELFPITTDNIRYWGKCLIGGCYNDRYVDGDKSYDICRYHLELYYQTIINIENNDYTQTILPERYRSTISHLHNIEPKRLKYNSNQKFNKSQREISFKYQNRIRK